MSKGAQKQLLPSHHLIKKNPYVRDMYEKYPHIILDETKSRQLKGKWRSAFDTPASDKKNHSPKMASEKALFTPPLNLEIGPGLGHHLYYQASCNPAHCFLGMEMKYKPLIKTAKKLAKLEKKNAKLIRYNGRLLHNLFSKKELSNIYIHFPDPWPKKRHLKHRLITDEFAEALSILQDTGTFIEIKTDHKLYFQQILSVFKKTPYKILSLSYDFHKESDHHTSPVLTQFEKIFISQNLPVYYVKYSLTF